jgi:radical SAM superfamily enzyme YgiQ (UPF0313 family)
VTYAPISDQSLKYPGEHCQAQRESLAQVHHLEPLGLLIVAALTPPEWDITVIDENLGIPDYATMLRPDLVGITAFTSQAPRAYRVAAGFRSRGVPVVMGGIHATMCLPEALNRVYTGTHLGMDKVPLARHDLLPTGYRLGSIQTTRGCPLNCSFCSVTAFNGGSFRHRPIGHVVKELELIRERYVLIVDDNLVGIRKDHISTAPKGYSGP